MESYQPKFNLDDFIENNELNNQIYGVLMDLQDGYNVQYKLKLDIVFVFNKVYEMCHIISNTKRPEQYAPNYWSKIRSELLSYETSIIFSAVYIILFIQNNPKLAHCLRRIYQKIDPSYFAAFEPILNNSMAYADNRTLPVDFIFLKSEADKIADLSERELYYQEYQTRYKQAKNQGDILQQIEDEIKLIERIRELSVTNSEEIPIDEANNLSGKVKYIIISELLKQIGKGKANNDLSVICRFVSFLTGLSEKRLYNEAQKGIILSDYHNKEIEQANKILSSLNISFTVQKDREY